ncbi:MAG: cobyrinate a,c-diamide synthase [Thermoflexales bacterium]|nr:cobyrinate a,c-diamide synthase [Thermoflexales bacterium]MDW8352075.1 cobyrinate a,c-diamide synthase [Anaerolineae bacterium]
MNNSAPVPAVVIAAPQSGSGKTTVTAGLICALVGRGFRVVPFKVGPDYIDPSLLAQAAGQACHNLDVWMLGEAGALASFARRSRGADLAVIEGVMGLFDGVSGEDDAASAAHVARLLDAPVVLVLDAQAMARTAAAVVRGLSTFDPRVNVAGVIFNRVGSSTHATMLREAVERHTGVRVLGSLIRDDRLKLPERHLGLVPAAERDAAGWIEAARMAVEGGVDVDALVHIARARRQQITLPLNSADGECARPSSRQAQRPRIAVARDEAFSFIYPDNLELLEAAGAELAFFSPLRDPDLPKGCGALILCGGFPELYAAQLAANAGVRKAIADAAAAGMPIYAECGGFMYLCEALVDQAGLRHAMCGVLPGHSVMTPRLTLGYRLARAPRDNWLWRAGETIRGHEFHYSTWQKPNAAPEAAYTLLPMHYQKDARPDGAQVGNVIASYLHLHFLAKPELAERLVRAAGEWLSLWQSETTYDTV